MKTFIIAAGALLMGTSAFAYDGGKDFNGTIAKPEKAAAIDQSQQMKKAVTDVLSDAKADAIVQPASAVTWDSTGADAKWQPASAVNWDSAKSPESADVSTELPSDAPAQVDTGQGDPNMDLTVNPDSVVDDAAPVADAALGVGGPDEAVQVASADLAPRPAAANYPACRPGPGDDSCIQLYEPGVRQQLASWTQSTGGFAGAETQTAMGGPYEPVDSADSNGAADEVLAASDAEVEVAPQTLAYAGDSVDSGPLDDEGVI